MLPGILLFPSVLEGAELLPCLFPAGVGTSTHVASPNHWQLSPLGEVLNSRVARDTSKTPAYTWCCKCTRGWEQALLCEAGTMRVLDKGTAVFPVRLWVRGESAAIPWV